MTMRDEYELLMKVRPTMSMPQRAKHIKVYFTRRQTSSIKDLQCTLCDGYVSIENPHAYSEEDKKFRSEIYRSFLLQHNKCGTKEALMKGKYLVVDHRWTGSPRGEYEVKVVAQSHRGHEFTEGGKTYQSDDYFKLCSAEVPGCSDVSGNMVYVRGLDESGDDRKIFLNSQSLQKFLRAVRAYNLEYWGSEGEWCVKGGTPSSPSGVRSEYTSPEEVAHVGMSAARRKTFLSRLKHAGQVVVGTGIIGSVLYLGYVGISSWLASSAADAQRVVSAGDVTEAGVVVLDSTPRWRYRHGTGPYFFLSLESDMLPGLGTRGRTLGDGTFVPLRDDEPLYPPVKTDEKAEALEQLKKLFESADIGSDF